MRLSIGHRNNINSISCNNNSFINISSSRDIISKWYSIDNGTTWQTNEQDKIKTTYTFAGLQKGTEYKYRVKVIDNAGNETITNETENTKIATKTGNVVTYQVDTNTQYKEEVGLEESCLSPTTFTPSKSGWTFVGWREDKTANGSVLSTKKMGEDPITLYAVFKQTVTITYSGNGNTGGSTAAQSGDKYYNNGNTVNPSFTLRANGFSKTNNVFYGWKSGSTLYTANQTITTGANLTMLAQWQTTSVTNFSYTGGIQSYKVTVTGLYLLKAYGAKGGNSPGATGGNGGYSYRYVTLNAGSTIYIVCGGAGGNYNGSSAGGGGSGYIGTSSITYKGKTYTNGMSNGSCSGNGSASIQFITP